MSKIDDMIREREAEKAERAAYVKARKREIWLKIAPELLQEKLERYLEDPPLRDDLYRWITTPDQGKVVAWPICRSDDAEVAMFLFQDGQLAIERFSSNISIRAYVKPEEVIGDWLDRMMESLICTSLESMEKYECLLPSRWNSGHSETTRRALGYDV